MTSRFLTGTALASLALTTTATGQDQDGGNANFVVEELVVTAQKRESTLLETPVAITAIGGVEVSRAQARDVRDLSTLVPSLQINTFAAPSNTAFSIRGIGSSTFNFGIEPAVGVFVDGVYRARNGASINDFLGLERVEVLRGPQSTLFGKNTTGGVINFITKLPNQEEWDIEGELTYGNYDATVIKAGISGPIIEDVLAIRLDGNFNQRDGFVENISNGDQLNERDRYGLRGQLYFTPNDQLSVRLIADYNDLDENCCAAGFIAYPPGGDQLLAAFGGVAAPADPFARQVAVNGGVNTELENWGFSAQIDYDFGDFTLTSTTAYRELEELQRIDSDFTDLALAQPRTITQGYETFTQELRIASNGSNIVDWQFGAYFFDQSLNTNNQTVFAPLARPVLDALAGGGISGLEASLGIPAGTFLASGSGLLRSLYEQENTSYSFFAQADWHVTDRLTVSAGLRYVVDEKNVVSDVLIDDPFAAVDLVQVGAAGISAATGLPIALLLDQANFTNGVIDGALAGTGIPSSAVNPQNPLVNPALGLADLQLFPPTPNIDLDREDDALVGNITFAYDVSDTTNVYLNYSRGFKGGGFSLDPGAVRVGQVGFDPETADSIELGLKGRYFDGKLSVNAAGFWQEVDDFQQFIFVGSSFFPANAGIRTAGLEVEAAWAVTPNFNITSGFTWLATNEFTEFENGPCPSDFEQFEGCSLTVLPGSITPVPVQDLSGVTQAGFPEFSGVTTFNYNRSISDNLDLFARAEIAYNTAYFIVTSLDPNQRNSAFFPVGASVGIADKDGQWQLQFWGRNIFDEEFLQSSFPNPIGFGLNGYPNDPQTYGVTLSFNL